MVQLQTYIGLLGYWKTFVPHLALLACPLYFLKRKGLTWEWSNTVEQAFQATKQAVQQAQVLQAVDTTKPFKLDVRVAQEGCGWDFRAMTKATAFSWDFGPNCGKGQKQGTLFDGEAVSAVYATLLSTECYNRKGPGAIKATCPRVGWLHYWL